MRIYQSALWITLWIQQVIHALTVALNQVIHALTVALLRINGRTTNKYLYFSFITNLVVRDTASVDNRDGLSTIATVINHKQEKKMKKPNRLTTLILYGCLLASINSIGHAQTTSNEKKTSIGLVSCETWLEERKENKTITYAGIWINGYLSGLNLLSGKDNDFLANIKSANQIHIWVDNYCQQNSSKNIDVAALSLALELMATK